MARCAATSCLTLPSRSSLRGRPRQRLARSENGCGANPTSRQVRFAVWAHFDHTLPQANALTPTMRSGGLMHRHAWWDPERQHVLRLLREPTLSASARSTACRTRPRSAAATRRASSALSTSRPPCATRSVAKSGLLLFLHAQWPAGNLPADDRSHRRGGRDGPHLPRRCRGCPVRPHPRHPHLRRRQVAATAASDWAAYAADVSNRTRKAPAP